MVAPELLLRFDTHNQKIFSSQNNETIFEKLETYAATFR